MRGLKSFAKDDNAAATIEFIVVFLAFISMMMFIVEMAIYMFFMVSLEKAAEAGVRYAALSQPVTNQPVAATNDPDDSVRGQDCSASGDGCDEFTTRRCTGSGCNTTRMNRLLEHMQGYNATIRRQNVTVTYEDVGIGFAGGPTVPMVTVTISGIRFETGIFRLLIGNSANGLGTLPTRSASMTGEALGR
jgi:Flp pilus assembly protein TadG